VPTWAQVVLSRCTDSYKPCAISGILGSCGQRDILIDIIPCKRIWQINNRSHAFPEALGDKKQFRLEFNSNLKTGTKTGGKLAAQRKDHESISRQRDCRRQPFFAQVRNLPAGPQ
jgi:hypothetical protein